jgi:hypothetical protein
MVAGDAEIIHMCIRLSSRAAASMWISGKAGRRYPMLPIPDGNERALVEAIIAKIAPLAAASRRANLTAPAM